MLKKLVMAGIPAMIATFALSTHPDKTADKKASDTTQSPPSVILAFPEHANSGNTDQSKPNLDAPHHDAPLKRPDWWVVIVATVTGLFVAWQAFETRKAADASWKSIALQEAAYQQWIEFHNWTASLDYIEKEHFLDVQVEILNPTAWPLTLVDGYIAFSRGADGGGGYSEDFNESISLVPKIPHKVTVLVEITKRQAEIFKKENLNLSVSGKFRYVGALQKPTIQELRGILFCSENGKPEFRAILSMIPKQQK